MKKIWVGTDECDDEVFRIENNKPVEFLCEHCGKMRRKIYYKFGGNVNYCEICFTTFNITYEKNYKS
jgi:hypothetical protein